MDIKYSFQAWKVIHDRDKKPWPQGMSVTEYLFGPFTNTVYDEVEYTAYEQQLAAYIDPLSGIMSEIEREIRSGPLSPMEILKREIKSDLDKHDANLLAMFRTIGF